MSGRAARTTDPEPVGCDTSDLIIVHRLYRMVFTDAPGLVRGVPDGDAARTAVVADHVTEIADALHHHHTIEDELLWDRLETRAPACALHVGLMRTQHAAVAEHLDALATAVADWRRSSARSDGERVALVLDDIHRLLVQHLGDEEDRIVPVAARTMTQSEWDELGERGRAATPRDRQMVLLGYMLASFDSAQERQAWVRANLPLPVRALFAVVGKRQFDAYRRRVAGERSPA